MVGLPLWPHWSSGSWSMKKAARLRCPLFPVVMLNPHGQLSSDSLRKGSCLEAKCILPQQKSETVYFTLYSTHFYPTSGLDFTSLHFWGGCYTCSPWLHIPNSSSSERSRPNTCGVGSRDWGIQHKTRGFRGICHIRWMGLSYPIYHFHYLSQFLFISEAL